jgi:hypothetical protein
LRIGIGQVGPAVAPPQLQLLQSGIGALPLKAELTDFIGNRQPHRACIRRSLPQHDKFAAGLTDQQRIDRITC